MKINHYFVVIALVCGFFACEKTSISNSPVEKKLMLNDTLKIAYQDTLRNTDENSWLTFSSLVADSRCAINVVCVWEGNAEISFTFFNGIKGISFNLNTHPMFVRDTTVLGFDFSLIEVDPYPHIDSLYTPNDYSVSVLITNN